MVQRGQFLERPTLVPLGAEVLEGLSHRGNASPGVLVVPPPPAEGGSMDHVVAAEVVWAAATAGHPTLRFNFRGVGASQGRRGRGEALRRDARAALEALESNLVGDGARRVALIALAGTGELALALARETPVAGVCLIGPSTFSADWARPCPVQIIVAEEDLALPRAVFPDLVVIPGADRAFTRNLPLVGKTVVEWLKSLERAHESP